MKEIKVIGTTRFAETDIKIIEGGFSENCRIMTAHTISQIHKVAVGEINRLTNDNIEEFEEGVDVLNLLAMGGTHSEINELFSLNLPNNTKNFFIYSEQGYMALVGLMRTAEAREIRKQVRREYFAMREIINSDEQKLAMLTLNIYKGGQDALLAAKELTEIEVAKATKPLIETIEVQKPKVDFADRLLKSKDNILVREFSKILQEENVNIGEKKLYKWLRENKYLMKNNEPYQSYMKYFVVVENSIDTPFGIKLVKTTKINPNGQLFFYNKLKNEF